LKIEGSATNRYEEFRAGLKLPRSGLLEHKLQLMFPAVSSSSSGEFNFALIAK
jgi:hypothetical protein